MGTPRHTLAEVMDLERVQRVCEGLSRASGLTLAVLDPDGAVLIASGWQDVCTQFHRRHETSAAACTESDLRIGRTEPAAEGAPASVAYRCANGLWDVAFPLVVDGEHLGTVFTGQFFYADDEVDEVAFRARAEELGYDVEAYMEALRRVPVVTHAHAEQTIAFLADFVGLLAELGLGAVRHERATAAQRGSEAAMLAVFDGIDEPIYASDPETYEILFANHALADVFGPIAGRRCYEYLQHRDAPCPFCTNDRIFAEEGGEPYVWELTNEVTGRSYHCIDRAIPWPDGRRVRLEMAVDITDRRRDAEELQRSREVLRAVLDAVPMRVFWKDRDLRYLGANLAFARDAGLEDPADLVGKDDYEMVWQDEAELYRADDAAVIASGEAKYLIEEPQTTPSGDQIWLLTSKVPLRDPEGETVGVLGTYYDITARREAVEALSQSRQQYETFVQATDDLAFLKDEGLRYVIVNESNAAFFGRSVDEIIGRTDEELMPPAAAANCRASDLAAMRSDGVVITTEEVDGRLYEARKFPVPLSHGRVGVGGYIRDVTEQRRAAAEVARLNADLERLVESRTAQLEAANRELESFAYSISHDLRAPLRALDGFSEILLEDHGDVLDDAGRSHLRRIQAAAAHMAELMDGLLQLSRLSREEIELRPVDLSALGAEVVEALRAEDPGRDVDVAIAPDLTTSADPKLLRIVLDNLLGNAWKFTSRHETARIELGAEGTDDGSAFFVRDDGAGFDQVYAKNLFGAFQRLHTTDEFQGTGIGLATVQRIVHRHGGTVWAEGEVEKGATFWFTLGTPGVA